MNGLSTVGTRTARAPIPSPDQRLTPQLYLHAKRVLLAQDEDAAEMLRWAQQDLKPPKTAEDLAGEIVWIILCAGRSAQAARTLEKRVWASIDGGKSAFDAFGYRKKADAIDRAWRDRALDFTAYRQVAASSDAGAFIEWAGSIPFVGDDTKFQLAKNLGYPVSKPDIWLCRLAGIPDKPRLKLAIRFESCMVMCNAIADATGDSVPVVDSVAWLACNKGVLQVSADAGPITVCDEPPRRRSIYVAG